MLEESIAIQKDFERGREPVICTLDLEISPMLVYTYSAYEGNALKIKVAPMIVSFAWQYHHEKKIHVRSLPNYKGYKSGILHMNDKKLVQELHEVMEASDMLVGHNFKDFDLKHAKARFIYHDLPVTKKWMVEDTLKMARKYFKFPKNNLDYVTELLGMEGKTDVKHSDVIWKCIDGDMKAWKAMEAYNIQDIKISRALYERLSPWHENHANLNLIKRGGQVCKVCLANGKEGKNWRRKGIDWNKTFGRQKYLCNECGHAWRGERIEKESEKVEQYNI